MKGLEPSTFCMANANLDGFVPANDAIMIDSGTAHNAANCGRLSADSGTIPERRKGLELDDPRFSFAQCRSYEFHKANISIGVETYASCDNRHLDALAF
jgi:hypothetical protein